MVTGINNSRGFVASEVETDQEALLGKVYRCAEALVSGEYALVGLQKVADCLEIPITVPRLVSEYLLKETNLGDKKLAGATLTLEKRVIDLQYDHLIVDDFWIDKTGQIHLKERFSNVTSFASFITWLSDLFEQLISEGEADPKKKGNLILQQATTQVTWIEEALGSDKLNLSVIEVLQKDLQVLKHFTDLFVGLPGETACDELDLHFSGCFESLSKRLQEAKMQLDNDLIINQFLAVHEMDVLTKVAGARPGTMLVTVDDVIQRIDEALKVGLANPKRYGKKEESLKELAAAHLLAIQSGFGLYDIKSRTGALLLQKIVAMESKIESPFFLKSAEKELLMPYRLQSNEPIDEMDRAFLQRLLLSVTEEGALSIEEKKEFCIELVDKLGDLDFLLNSPQEHGKRANQCLSVLEKCGKECAKERTRRASSPEAPAEYLGQIVRQPVKGSISPIELVEEENAIGTQLRELVAPIGDLYRSAVGLFSEWFDN